MTDLSDDEYDLVSDMELGSEDENETATSTLTSATTPPSARASSSKKFECPYDGCVKSFSKKGRLEEHIRSHKGIRLHKCTYPDCAKDFLRKSHLQHHVKGAHTNERDWGCSWQGCGKKFATGTRLRRHLKAHEEKDQFTCKGYAGCNQTFRKHETLKRHVLSVHEQIRPFPCTYLDTQTHRPCSKAFESADKLRSHQNSCHDQTRFSCSVCLDLLASANAGLADDHTILPTQVYFAKYSELQDHIAQVHPPTCDNCHLVFGTPKELTRHRELQHAIVDPTRAARKTFPCPSCGREFTKRGNLSVHINTVHQKKRDFVCGSTELVLPQELSEQPDVSVVGCGRGFSSKASLEEHVRTAHLGLPRRRLERERKRKAARQPTSDDEDSEFEQPQARKPRKDKGVRKTKQIINDLTGAHQYQPGGPLVDHLQHNGTGQQFYAADAPGSLGSANASPPDGDADDWNQLDGSMTLFGDHLYANGQRYHFSAGDYPPGLSRPEMSDEDLARHRMWTAEHGPQQDAILEDEPIFDNFEHEPESLALGELSRYILPVHH